MCTKNATFALYFFCFLARAAFAFSRNMQQSIPFATNPAAEAEASSSSTDLDYKATTKIPLNVPPLGNTTNKNWHPASTPVTVPWHDAVGHSVATGLNFSNSKDVPGIRQGVRRAVVKKIEDCQEKNHSAWVKSTDVHADILQVCVIVTGTTANGIDAINRMMETIGGPTFCTRLDERTVSSKSCKNLSMNAILKTWFNVAHSYNLDSGTKEKSSVVNGHRATCYDGHMPVTSCGVTHRNEFRMYFHQNIETTVFNITHLFNLESGTKEKASVGKGHHSREFLGPGFGIEDVVQRACAFAKKKGYEHLGEGAVLCERR
jgi:hypothetical protein